MSIGLIAMSGVRVRTAELASLGVTLPQFVSRGKVIASLPSLGLLTVAGLTPADCDVQYREIAELDREAALEPFDLVGISSFTAQIDEAYALADRYRAAGVPVVLGGLHVSLMPDEAAAHADAIVLNGAEGVWPHVVEDARRGQLQPRYYGLRTKVFDDEHYVMPRFDLLAGRSYNRVTVQTSRGCPLNCEFCAASIRITSSYQQKSVARSICEIRAALAARREPFLELADDNTFVNKKWGRAFLRAIAPLGVRWFTETDISIADDETLLDLLAESGCRQVLIGLESPDATGLDGLDPRTGRSSAAAATSMPSTASSRAASPSTAASSSASTITRRRSSRRSATSSARRGCSRCRSPCRRRSPARRSTRVCSARVGFSPSATGIAARSSTSTTSPKHMSVDELESGVRWLFGEIYNEKRVHPPETPLHGDREGDDELMMTRPKAQGPRPKAQGPRPEVEGRRPR